MTEKDFLANTSLGVLQGIKSGTVIQFRGVPYTKPPVKDLRFAPPQEMSSWTGIRLAREHGPIPPQPPSRLSSVLGDFSRPQDEDCLTLTISTPAIDKKARPVLVFLHGGGYLTGAGSLDWYDGSTLAHEGDLVVVGVNYRLGVLGFLYQPGISDGQLGIQDMIAALEWVKDNIADFGGDPNQITVMGQSGGGQAIMCMLAMPETRRLFQRAILQSAPVGAPPFSKATALEYGNQFLSLLGIKTRPARELIQRLKTETPANLIMATGKLVRSTASFGDVTPPFMPVFEDISTQEHFIQAAADGAATARVEVIIGTNGQEANAYFNVLSMQKPDLNLVSQRFLTLTGRGDAIDLYRQRRPGGTAADLLSDLTTDHYFLFPSLKFADAASKAGVRTWVYQFDWSPPNSPFKACHCIELPFVFGTLSAWNSAPMLNGADSSVVKDLSAAIRHMWLAFVKKGNPELNIPWLQYRSDSRQTMQFGDTVGPVGDLGGLTWRYHA